MNPLAPEYYPSSNSEYVSLNFPQDDLSDSSNYLLQNLFRNILRNRSMNPLAPDFYPRSWNRNI